MKQTAAKYQISEIEKTAWELFEVGSFSDVVRLAKNHIENEFLNHLGLIASFENGAKNAHEFVNFGISSISAVADAYRSYYNYQYKESAKQIHNYFSAPGAILNFIFVNFAVKATAHAGLFKECQQIISLYRKKFKDDSFVREEIECLFNLKSYNELLELFKKHSSILNDKDMHMMLGLSLFYLGKSKEATVILEKIPEKLELPSFESKKKNYLPVIKRIPELEKSKNSMSYQQLTELGFAYLFNEDFKKAEETFNQAIVLSK